jgi:hypothetical protein
LIRHKNLFLAGICALTATIAAVPAMAQQPPMAKGDPREAVALAPGEVETLLAGMRTYLESIQGIVEVTAENKVARVSAIASKAGSKLLQGTSPMTGLKVPLGFTSMSLDTHDKFDKLAEKAEHGASRTEILYDLSSIMSNCVSCHASYRLAPAGRRAN